MAIFEVRKGVKRELSSREVKQRVMEIRGWTSDEYNKEYDKLRNRVRAYESYQAQSGVIREKQSVATILYREAKAIKREGDEYKPTLEMERLKSFPSISSGKALQRRLQDTSRWDVRYSETTVAQFSGLINANPIAREIMEKIENPVQREKALKDLAEKLHVRIDESQRAQAQSAIPFGQTAGSKDTIDFDISKYL
ncbi:MAG: hypothetical protein J6A63_00155 [Clostridia bacterium]|nr:hypothetical protein [Clostridia bacterium]